MVVVVGVREKMDREWYTHHILTLVIPEGIFCLGFNCTLLKFYTNEYVT